MRKGNGAYYEHQKSSLMINVLLRLTLNDNYNDIELWELSVN
jgi:hypothetical protein